MTPRPRKVSDEDVFAAVFRVMGRRLPAEVKLTEIAAEAGVTPGALVQRFGSKRALLLTVAEASAAAAGTWIGGLREEGGSALDAIFAYADCLAAMGGTPAGFAHHLAWLHLDLSDEEFRGHLRTHGAATRAALRALVVEAMEAGELKSGTDPDELARAIDVTLSGSLMTWAFHDEGTAREWLRRDLEVLLRPYRAG